MYMKWHVDLQNRVHEHSAVAAHAASMRHLNLAPDFSPVYEGIPGSIRRRALVALFKRYPNARLAVNCGGRAYMRDPDLRILLKKKVLARIRERDSGAQRKPTFARTYLVLVKREKRLSASQPLR